MGDNKARDVVEYVYSYVQDRNHELPCDLSENAFWNELERRESLSDSTDRRMLASIIQLADDEIFKDIYKNRFAGSKNTNSEVIGSATRKRNQFYGEVRELLQAIIVAYDENNALRKEQLAKKTFDRLADRISSKKEEEILEDYVFLSMLHNDCIKRSMLSQFHGELDGRLKTIKRLIANQSLHWTANHLLVTLHRLDAIIVDLVGATQNIHEFFEDNPDKDEYAGKSSKALRNLYFELMSTRKQISKRNKAGETTKIIFELPQKTGTQNADIICDIKGVLSLTTIGEKTRREKFSAIYRRFLFEANKDSAEIMDGEQFYKHYLGLKKYIDASASIDDFEREVREELNRIAYRTFAPIISEDYIPHFYSEARFSHARYAFAYTQLINAQDQIRYKVHKALQLLSSTYTIVGLLQVSDALPFSKGVNIEEFGKWLDLRNKSIIALLGKELESRVELIKQERERLHNEYPHLGLLHQYDKPSIQFFVRVFNSSCPETFKVSPLLDEKIETLSSELTQPTDILRALYIQAAFLQSECMIIINEEVENTVKALRVEYLQYESIK